MTMDENVAKAVAHFDARFSGQAIGNPLAADVTMHEWLDIRARLVELEAERWLVVATRNAAVMRTEKVEALLRECQKALPDYMNVLDARITATFRRTDMSERTVFLVYGYDRYEYPYNPIKAFADEAEARALLARISAHRGRHREQGQDRAGPRYCPRLAQ
jgi:hypothetical protein